MAKWTVYMAASYYLLKYDLPHKIRSCYQYDL